ncbi:MULTISPECIES: YjfB family protein [Lachnospira]|uniref:Putative motility protein n=2 Tax=Lachnospira TaxID=28050 RepID=A0A1H5W233_9FIRM|nr:MULTISPECIES: YjfB family protein [Lachnospira]MBQ2473506.1 YjfB family protein [Lachnospira sp.]MCR5515749.1 YjfB family protein [Lachnospira sp.]SDM39848.1 Putative motility protein [Lachnospira pectinoschiza]SEF93348.1 Putative motility protein [Lachnospira multipara]
MVIGGISTNISTTNVQSDVSVLMLRKQLDTVEQGGVDLTKMMEQSVNPEVGSNIDYSV